MTTTQSKASKNPVVVFYSALFVMISWNNKGSIRVRMESQIEHFLDLAQKCGDRLSIKVDRDWLLLIDRSFHDFDSFESDDEWLDEQESFFIHSFRDLSPMKDPRAQELLEEISELKYIDDCYVFARKIIRRKNGSAVLVLHVSNLEDFENRLDLKNGNLEDGGQIEP